jgi:TetR/AcrR family transcriptional regulator, regulator of cefoperazone and chloramphenicol sensitivity
LANTDSEATRRRLVDAAIGQFARFGFHGASSRELAKEARVNVAIVNYHFESKQGLYDAAVDEVYRRLRQRAAEVLLATAPRDLETLLERLYHAARQERDGVRLLVRQVIDHGRLTERTETSHFLPELQASTQLAADQLGCSVEQARTALVAVTYLVSRYVVQDDQSLVVAFGVKSAKQAHARVVTTLSVLARSLITQEIH